MHLYLHIPFCRQACYYCDFHFSTNLKAKTDIINALCREIELQANYLKIKKLDTIYFGGGTPSLLNQADFEQIFLMITKHFQISESAEITVEANPDDLNSEKLRLLKNLGVNRLSIGIQTFDATQLKFLNRIHSASGAENCVKLAQDLGIENISIDLIYGISSPSPSVATVAPMEIGGNHSIWEADLAKAVALKVPHISSYCLTIEPKTVFGKWLKINQLAPIDDEYAATQFTILIDTLAANKYEQYEISNFCLPEKHSRHNSSYWRGEEYLGIGPSAHSYNGFSRQYNVSNNANYIKGIAQNIIPCEVEILTDFDKVNDYLLTTLRTSWGTDLRKIREIIGEKFEQENKKQLAEAIEKKWLTIDNQIVSLTKSGKLFADKIAADLFLI